MRNSSQAVWSTFLHVLISCMIISLAPATSRAQVTTANWEQEISTWPADLQLKPLKTGSYNANLDAWIVNDAQSGLTAPRADAKKMPGSPADFMDSFFVVDIGSEDINGYCLLAKIGGGDTPKRDDLFGWVPRQLVLFGDQPLKKDGTPLYKKARYVFSVEAASALKKMVDDGVELSAEDARTIRLTKSIVGNETKGEIDSTADLMYIYGQAWVKSGKLTAPDEGERYVLVGTKDRIQGPNNEERKRVIKGWVKAAYVSEWTSRRALEWNYETLPLRERPGKVFSTYRLDEMGRYVFDAESSVRLALEAAAGKNSPPKGDFSMTEGDLPFSDDDWRMPILQEIPLSQVRIDFPEVWNELSRSQKENIVTFGNKLYRVGWEGKGSSAAKVDQLQVDLNQAARKLANMELVFVIDHTDSMKPVFSEVATACARTIISLADNNSISSLKVSICFYGSEEKDFLGQPLQAESLLPLKPLQRELLMKLANPVDSGSRQSILASPSGLPLDDPILELMNRLFRKTIDGKAELYENVNHAMGESLKTLSKNREQPKHATQIVVLIGDAADRSFYVGSSRDAAESSAKSRRREREISLIQRLIWGENEDRQFDRRFLAIRYSNQSPSAKPVAAYTDFKTMIETWISYGNRFPDRPALGFFQDAVGPGSVEQLVTQQLEELGSKVGELRQEIDDLKVGRSHTVSKDLAEYLGMTPEDANRILSDRRFNYVYCEAYVWDLEWRQDEKKIPVLRERVLLSNSEVLELKKVLEGLNLRDETVTLLQIMEKLFGGKAGELELYVDKPFEQLWQQRYDLNLTSGLFKRTPRQLITYAKTYNELLELERQGTIKSEPAKLSELETMRQELYDLFESSARLTDILARREYDEYKPGIDDVGLIEVKQVGSPKSRNRWFEIPGTSNGEKWIWLRVDRGSVLK